MLTPHLVSHNSFMFYSNKTGYETMATVESINKLPMSKENTYFIVMKTDIGSFALTRLTENGPEEVYSVIDQDVHDLMYPADEPDVIDVEHGYFKMRSIGDEETLDEYQTHLDEAIKNGGGISEELSRKLSHNSAGMTSYDGVGDAVLEWGNPGTWASRGGQLYGLAGGGNGAQLRDAAGRFTSSRANPLMTRAGPLGRIYGVGQWGYDTYTNGFDPISSFWTFFDMGAAAVGASSGCQVGAVAGPWGCAIGGLIGGIAMLFVVDASRDAGAQCSSGKECENSASHGSNSSGGKFNAPKIPINQAWNSASQYTELNNRGGPGAGVFKNKN